MDINYDEIRRIYRLEKNTAKISDVDDDFYVKLSEYLKESKKEYLKKIDELDSKDTKMFVNIKKMIEEIFLLRMRKIINKSLLFVLTEDEQKFNMSVEERKLFNNLVNDLKRHRELEKKIFNGEGAKSEKIEIEIIKDVPEFVGPDMKEYGEYKKGEKINVDSKIASLLIERKLGKQV